MLDRAIADQGRYPGGRHSLFGLAPRPSRSGRPSSESWCAKLRSLIARYEETRELRLMGGYTPGADVALDKAIKAVPRIYEAMTQSLDAPQCEDPFIDLAAALRNDGKSPEA